MRSAISVGAIAIMHLALMGQAHKPPMSSVAVAWPEGRVVRFRILTVPTGAVQSGHVDQNGDYLGRSTPTSIQFLEYSVVVDSTVYLLRPVNSSAWSRFNVSLATHGATDTLPKRLRAVEGSIVRILDEGRTVWLLDVGGHVEKAFVVSREPAPEPPLTLADVRDMRKKGLSDVVIVARIRGAERVACRLSTDDLLALKNEGFSDDILAALVARGH